MPIAIETSSIHRRLSFVLQGILLIEVLVALSAQQWLTAVISLGIIMVTVVPLLLARRFQVFIPPQFQLLAIGFVFASLFLGEVRNYYTRFWWWDTVLHTFSGFLLGMVGFLLVHILNEIEDVGFHMKPGFVAFFALMFAIGMGAVWEIFEFTMDTSFGMNMQKAMLGDESGLIDTMTDLIVDALGALIMCLYGYHHLKVSHSSSFLERWISIFIQKNPDLFRRKR